MKFERIQPGMVLYDVHSYKMGNTSISSLGVWSARVVEVDSERRRASVVWNGNKAEWWGEKRLSKLKATKPVLIASAFGRMRRPTREELAQIKAAAKSEAA